MVDYEVRPICIKCGSFYDTDGYPHINNLCKSCNRSEQIVRMKEIYAKKRANGWVPESKRKAGRKAYITRMARMSFTHATEYQKRMIKEVKSNPDRAIKIQRKAKKLMKQRLGYADLDIGKAIF